MIGATVVLKPRHLWFGGIGALLCLSAALAAFGWLYCVAPALGATADPAVIADRVPGPLQSQWFAFVAEHRESIASSRLHVLGLAIEIEFHHNWHLAREQELAKTQDPFRRSELLAEILYVRNGEAFWRDKYTTDLFAHNENVRKLAGAVNADPSTFLLYSTIPEETSNEPFLRLLPPLHPPGDPLFLFGRSPENISRAAIEPGASRPGSLFF
ncbi:hypothetical protein C4587_01535 [Candidatus Parcubacteria bacterium]|nr:MAG: hypothetical protein C4587_01535 [Candidatus Parcubacteria bacterium]